MSVAFRRESDEEHKEPRFELPIPAGPNLVTQRGKAQIDARIAALEAAARAARDDAARESIRRDLRYWNTRRATAQVTLPPADGTAGFGAQVDYVLDAQPRRIAIVGDDEADPAAGRIGFSAPLARALMGAAVGETVAFNGRDDAITLTGVRPIDA